MIRLELIIVRLRGRGIRPTFYSHSSSLTFFCGYGACVAFFAVDGSRGGNQTPDGPRSDLFQKQQTSETRPEKGERKLGVCPVAPSFIFFLHARPKRNHDFRSTAVNGNR
eukprot:scaffold34618_cov159-Amphora_coffeaeformis.AAC.10